MNMIVAPRPQAAALRFVTDLSRRITAINDAFAEPPARDERRTTPWILYVR